MKVSDIAKKHYEKVSLFLKGLKPAENRLETWNKMLPLLFEMEARLLDDAARSKVLIEIADDDIEIYDSMVSLEEKIAIARADAAPYIKVLKEFQERLEAPEIAYTQYYLELRKGMTNIYYGKAKDGSDVWSKGVPKEIEDRKKETE